MNKLTITQKITFSAILLAFGIVSTMVFKMIPMGNFSFLRFSLTPSIVIFSSIWLGPLYGAIVGILSDLLPAFILSQGAYNPFLSVAYGLLGILPYFLFVVAKKAPKLFDNLYAVGSVFLLFFVLLVLGFYCNSSLDAAFGENGVWLKPLILAIIGASDIALLFLLCLLEKKRKQNPLATFEETHVMSLGVTCAISEFMAMTIGKSLAFFLFFLINGGGSSPFSYWYLFSMLIIGTAPSTLLDVYFNSWMLLFVRRFLERK